MTLEIESYECLCELKHFSINGIDAEYEDFGTKKDIDMGKAEDYGCGDMRFLPKPATERVLEKYGISNEEYDLICGKLEKELSFGNCAWCS